jgi:hypothetical protein
MPANGGEAIQVTRDGDLVLSNHQIANFFTSATNWHDRETDGRLALTVSPDGQCILYTQVEQGGSELMLVEKFR